MSNSSFLDEVLDSKVDDKSTAQKVRKDNYRQLVRFQNVTSYSMQQTLHTCPRKFQLMKMRADNERFETEQEGNPDFAFGHAVGAGVAEYDKTLDINKAIFAAFLAWNIDLDATGQRKESGRDPKKSFPHAVWALKLYEEFHREEGLAEYEVEIVEATIAVDMEDGNFYVGHIDELLKNRETGRRKIKENKTTVYDSVDPAMYANSDQALSYSVVVSATGETEYDVFYCIYSSTSQRWIRMDFTKTALSKAEWLQGQLLVNSEIEDYTRINFFPKRGSGCINFGRRCEFYEGCDFNTERVFGKKFDDLDAADSFADIEAIEALDYAFKFSDLVGQQETAAQLESRPDGRSFLDNKDGMETL